MATTAPSAPLQIGQIVARRSEPMESATVGVVGGLVFVSDPPLVLVRWRGGRSTFEPEETLVEVFRLER